jgi:Putative Flp pilus-assembly TadE/G-like
MTRKREAGQALVLSAVALVALLGAMGLAIDMGVLRYDKRLQQTAADAAAIAGATNIINMSQGDGAGGTGVVTAGQDAAAANGFADTAGNCTQNCPGSSSVGYVSVTINNPPATGPHVGDSNYVEALVTAVQPTYFAKVFGVGSATVEARAVATAQKGYNWGDNCLITLQPASASIEGVNLTGNPILNAPTCGIADNGNFNTKGNALTVSADTFQASGDWVSKGTQPSDITCNPGAPACPETNVSGATDPVAANLGTAPTPSATPYTVNIAGSGDPTCGGNCTYINGTYYISPGTFCSITIQGVASDKVVFNSGLYIIEGEDAGCTTESLNIPGNATISGTNVTFYFTGSSTLNITGTPTMNLIAPTGSYCGTSTDCYAGMLFWEDPTDTNTTPQLGGNDGSVFSGIIYFPNDQLTFFGNATSGCTDPSTCGITVDEVVVGSLALSGTPDVNILGPGSLPSGVDSAVVPALVE